MEILGLIETLESMICDSPKIPFTGKTLIDENEILKLIDKMRLVLQTGGGFIRSTMGAKQGRTGAPMSVPETQEAERSAAAAENNTELQANEVIQQAYQVAKEIRTGADKYADEVLSGLEATTSRIIRTIKNGRSRLGREATEGEKLI